MPLPSAADQLQGIDIAKVLREKGPIVTCVVLRAPSSKTDQKPSGDGGEEADSSNVEEIQLDTTPKKAEVETLLGGPFTFVGQYEEEGIMLMAKRGCVFHEDDHDDDERPLHLERNLHKLQPPFDRSKVYGDILLLKVAECEDPLDDDDQGKTEETVVGKVATNDEFFLHYTKEEYLKFAARTDVVPPAVPSDAEEEEDDGGDDDDEAAEGEWSGAEDDDDDDEEEDEKEAQAAMMQLLMTTVLRKFQEENGRGPSTEELLVLKKTIAEKLGIPTVTEATEDLGEVANDKDQCETTATKEDPSIGTEQENKRSVEDSQSDDAEPSKKKVKFGVEEAEESKVAVLGQ